MAQRPVSIVSHGDSSKKIWWKISLGDYERICYKSNSELTDESQGIIKRKSHKNVITYYQENDNPNKRLFSTQNMRDKMKKTPTVN